MSFFVMGLGQIYAGHVDRGIMLLAIHISGIFSAFSIYSRGIVFETLNPVFGTNTLVLLCYFACVIFILLWIYNIKDAYYLSLFSSFRDWFEVERVLLPVLKIHSDNLLTGPEIADNPLPAPAREGSQSVHADFAGPDEADVVEVAAKVSVNAEAREAPATSAKPESDQSDEQVFYEDVDSISFDRQSWKLYLGLALIFLLLGLWLIKEPEKKPLKVPEPETLFAMTADLPDPALVEKIKDNEELVEIANQQVLGSIQTTFTSSAAATLPEVANAEPEPEVIPFAKGIEYSANRDFARACAEFEKDLLLADPDRQTWAIILNTFYRSDNRLAYELKLRKYLEAFPDDAAAWFNLGKILYDRNEAAQSAQALVQGLKYDPENVRGNFLLGSIYHDLRLYQDAVVYLRKAIAFEPLNVEFSFELAQALHESGDKDEALKFFQRVLSVDPTHEQAMAAVKKFSSRPMEDGASEVATLLPDEEGVVVIQGKQSARVLARSEAPSPAAIPISENVLFETDETLATAVETTDESQNTQKPVVLFTAPEKVTEAAVTEKTPVAVADTSENESKSTTEVVKTTDKVQAGAAKKPDKKIKLAANAGISEIEAGIVPAAGEDNLMNAVALEQAGADEALEEIRKSAFKEYSKGNWERSLPLYLEFLKKKQDPAAFDIVSIIFEKLNMANDAFDACEHAFKLGHRDLSTLIRLGRLAEETGRYEIGEKYLQMALEKSPHRVDLRIRLARCLAMNGSKDEAVSVLEAIIADNSSSYSVKSRVESEMKEILRKAN